MDKEGHKYKGKDGEVKTLQKGMKPFVKGDPRINRKGAPKRIIQLKRLLEETLGIKEGEDISKSSIAQIIFALTRQGKKGNVAAAALLLDRLYGKTPQLMELQADVDVRIPDIKVFNNAPPLAGSEYEIDKPKKLEG